MLTYCVKQFVSNVRRGNNVKTSPCTIAFALQHNMGGCSAVGSNVAPPDSDHFQTLLQLCTDRHYIAPGQTHTDSLQRGLSCNYGPLGRELRKNILGLWWHAVTRSKAQVFGISTPLTSKDRAIEGDRQVSLVDTENLSKELQQKGRKENQVLQRLQTLLETSASARTSLLPGALEQYVPTLELVDRKLPFGLAETGPCFQPSHGPGCPLSEVTQASLVWFCSPRTSSQWLDHWARQRLQWWRKFALGPSDFSCSDVPEGELGGKASRGVKIVYRFPWGPEVLETLWSRGDAELLREHKGVRSKLQCRDGRKMVVPHVVAVTANMDRGVIAYLCNSLQVKTEGRQRLQQRKVLKLHPVLAPIKVSLDMSKGATVELRRVCEGLQQELQEADMSTWPGYLHSMSPSLERMNTKYDEMGVLFTLLISENTLESGLLQVRNRDTTIKETMHISVVKSFLARYISAAKNM